MDGQDRVAPDEAARDEAAQRRSRRLKDLWQLHLPLLVALVICTSATVIEARRATEGVWRAWAYMIEWPLIGLFCIWIWHRYRTKGTFTIGMTERIKAHVARYGSVDDDGGPDGASRPAAPQEPPAAPADPELAAWRAYVAELHDGQDPPDRPPA